MIFPSTRLGINAAALFLLAGMFTARSNGTEFSSSEADIEFGRQILFASQVRSEEPPARATVSVQVDGGETVVLPARIDGDGEYALSAAWDVQVRPVFPFAQVAFSWEVEDPAGRKTASARQAVEYADDRFSWQRLERGKAVVYWVEGNAEDAGNAADLVLLTLGSVSAELVAPIPDLVQVYIYPRLEDLHSALADSVRGWEGGVSNPPSGVILVAAAPGADGRRTLAILLPHEVVHILLGMKYPQSIARLPAWLVEGLAASREMEPRPELDSALAAAFAKDDLLPLSALCAAFPSEEGPAILAYAESRSFVAFVRGRYGLDSIRRALDAYAAGTACPDGFLAPIGKTLAELETLWRADLAGARPAALPAAGLLAGGAGLLAAVALAGYVIRRKNRKPASGKTS
jgi:hypothetical protein